MLAALLTNLSEAAPSIRPGSVGGFVRGRIADIAPRRIRSQLIQANAQVTAEVAVIPPIRLRSYLLGPPIEVSGSIRIVEELMIILSLI